MSKLSDEEVICEWMTQIQIAQEQEVNATIQAIENQVKDCSENSSYCKVLVLNNFSYLVQKQHCFKKYL